MNLSFINRGDNRRLILIFAGWGMDANPFRGLVREGYDIAVAWDYTTEDFDFSALRHYREVVVIAWSLGVYEASRLLPGSGLDVTLTVAVNGTMTPVDDRRGIPVAVFDGTLATLSDASLRKFNRRMCGSTERLATFDAARPDRTLESLRSELAAIGDRAKSTPAPHYNWDIAIIGTADHIFPAAGQTEAWSGTRCDILPETPHIVDFQSLIDRYTVDKELVAARFLSTRESYGSEASVQRRVAERLVSLWHSHLPRRRYAAGVEIGAGTGILTHLYLRDTDIDRLELWDIAGVNINHLSPEVKTVTADAETQFPSLADASVDLLVSSSTLQWFNSPAAFLRKAARVLKPGAHVVLSLYGAGTFESFSRVAGVSLNYVTTREIISAAETFYDIIHVETAEMVETFPDVATALRHLQSTGVTGLRRSRVPVERMRRILADESMSRLVYHPIFIILQRKQQ